MTKREGNLVKKMKFVFHKHMYILDMCSLFEGEGHLEGVVMDN